MINFQMRKYLDILKETEKQMLDWRNMISQETKWFNTTKQDLTYKPHGSPVNAETVHDMGPFTYAEVDEPFVLQTVTSRGHETTQPVEKGMIIMSGPSGEKYYNKADKFLKNYPVDKGNGARGPDTKDLRTVTQYNGPAGTFAVSYGGTADIYPGDWLVKDTTPPSDPNRAPFYGVADHEFRRTYKLKDNT